MNLIDLKKKGAHEYVSRRTLRLPIWRILIEDQQFYVYSVIFLAYLVLNLLCQQFAGAPLVPEIPLFVAAIIGAVACVLLLWRICRAAHLKRSGLLIKARIDSVRETGMDHCEVQYHFMALEEVVRGTREVVKDVVSGRNMIWVVASTKDLRMHSVLDLPENYGESRIKSIQ